MEQFKELREWEQSLILSSLQRVASMMNAEHIDASPVLDVGAIDRYQTPLELTQKKEGQDSGKRANYSQSNTTERDGSH